MRLILVVLILPGLLAAGDKNAASRTWAGLQAKRQALSGVHQEFEVSQTTKTASGHTQADKSRLILDLAGRRWRQNSASGSGADITIFDGADMVSMEDGGDEFVRFKRKSKEDPLPLPYQVGDPDWAKAKEVGRQPCGLSGLTHQCVLIETPLKPWTHGDPSNSSKLLQGTARALMDLETGVLISARSLEVIQNSRNGAYERDRSYGMKRMSYGAALSAELFTVPKEAREVKELSRWDSAKIKKQLAGKPAPELAVVDLHGNRLTLADLKGKTVLLDFWTTGAAPAGPTGHRLRNAIADMAARNS